MLSCSCKHLKNVRTRANPSVASFSARNSRRSPWPQGELGDTLSDTFHAGIALQRPTVSREGERGSHLETRETETNRAD